MKFLVTGANGFIGRPLCAYLAARGHTVVPVVRHPSDIENARLITSSDDQAAYGAALSGCDGVIHLAGRAHVTKEREADPLRAFRLANVAVTLALARQAAAAGVRRFVFISAIKVNGERTLPGESFGADDPPDPRDAYALSKWEAEQGLRSIARETGMEVVIIRPPLVYGPGVKGNFAEMVKWVARGVPLPLGAVDNRRSLIALENILNFIEICADPVHAPQAANQLFLISDGQAISTPEMLRRLAQAYGLKPRLFRFPTGLMRFCARLLGKSGMADRLLGSLVINGLKAREMLGWRPPFSMEDQLRRMSGGAPS